MEEEQQNSTWRTLECLLPKVVTPMHYDISLHIDLHERVFSGEETVHVKVWEQCNTLVLHAVAMEVSAVNLNGIAAASWATSDEDDTLTVCLSQTLEANTNALLHINFNAVLSNHMKGLYFSSYVDATGNPHSMACTQFEPVDARRCFPCWDEPSLKATFALTIHTHDGYEVISNMPSKESCAAPMASQGWQVVQFETTPVMSTYLVAVVVGEFDVIQDVGKAGVNLRVFTKPGDSARGQFSLKTAVGALDFLTECYGIPFPLPKCDLVAIPDFESGAMENWGCITYRETRILVDEEQTSQEQRQRLTRTVCHELAHMWFGNLVTMAWWTDLWLNEGFARWVEHLVVDALFPEWHIFVQYIGDVVGQAMRLDALRTSHPVQVDVQHTDQIDEIFDVISYAKGSAVIRMLRAWLGVPNFQAGLHLYLNRFKYANAETGDLWIAMEEASGQPVRSIMEGWTWRMGFPVISVSLHSNHQQSLCLRQHRYLTSGPEVEEELDFVWQVPLQIAASAQSGPAVVYGECLLSEREGSADLPANAASLSDPKSWVQVNTGQTSFVRVSYERDLHQRLLKAVQGIKDVPVEDRLGLAMDTFSLADSGHHSAEFALDLLQAYRQEDAYPVLQQMAAWIRSKARLFEGQDWYPLFEQFAAGLFRPVLDRLGWYKRAEDEPLTIMKRTLAVSMLLRFGDVAALEEARRLFDKNNIPGDLYGPVLVAVVRYGGAAEFEAVRKMEMEATLSETKTRCQAALVATRSSNLMDRALQMAFGPEVRPQDTPSMLAAMASRSEGRVAAWGFLRNSFPLVKERFDKGPVLLGAVFQGVSGGLCSKKDMKVAQKFFLEQGGSGTRRAVQQILEKIQLNVDQVERDARIFKTWLEARLGARKRKMDIDSP